jgi:DNA ligase D-like protein (predicted polymerase)/DNA ligase D-like protein (predicted 3'-phosphoesterase)
MGLQTYRRKRNFTRTAEPRGVLARQNRQRFVVHEHHASHLHYDFRLEAGGVLKSWAIPKGPSLDPRQKRLAVMVEDHPVEYLHFVGHIAEGNYGAGEVLIWDSGHYELVTPGNLVEQIEHGKCRLILHGKKLRGEFHLVRMEGKDDQWLLIKGKDAFAAADKNSGVGGDVGQDRPTARRRGRTPRPALNHRRARYSTNTAKKQGASLSLAIRRGPEEQAASAPPARSVRPVAGAERAPMPDRVTPIRSLIRLLQAKASAGEVTVTLGDATLSLTHLDKVYWPEQGYTKGDLLRYYCEVAPAVLAYLKGRPLILIRYPNGITGSSFYQHDVDRVPAFVRTFPVKAESGKTVDYVVCDELATLLYLVNLGTIILNPWHSRIDNPETPDWVVFDLDPYEVNFTAVQELAVHLKVLLERFGLASYPKTSGASGMHVYVPIEPVYTYAQVAHFAELVARLATRESPQLATLERSLKKRPTGYIYLDHLQNARGKSVVAPYSVRAQPGAPVSTPLEWQEVQRPLQPRDFTIRNVPQRLARQGDPFAPVLTHGQRLDDALQHLEKLLRTPLSRQTQRRNKQAASTG